MQGEEEARTRDNSQDQGPSTAATVELLGHPQFKPSELSSGLRGAGPGWLAPLPHCLTHNSVRVINGRCAKWLRVGVVQYTARHKQNTGQSQGIKSREERKQDTHALTHTHTRQDTSYFTAHSRPVSCPSTCPGTATVLTAPGTRPLEGEEHSPRTGNLLVGGLH